MHPEISRSLNEAHLAEMHDERPVPARRGPRSPVGRQLRRRSGLLLVEMGQRLAGPAPH
jgi:hypothetical protein